MGNKKFSIAIKEAASLLYWTMLAACTVGPGTVVTCARAGAEFQLHLIWALLFATVLSYILLEGTVRLTITSGKSLGQCLQVKYRHGRLIWGVGVLGWIVSVALFIGNTLYECNTFAGGIAAIYALPGAKDSHGLRIGCCIAYGVFVAAILYVDKVQSLGVALGIVTVGMVVLFLIVVIKLGLNGERFGKGLLPISMPSGSENIVLSLIGTTAVGFNLFLGGKMAEGKTLAQAQRGVAFSATMALIVSVLILIVGDGTKKANAKFEISSLADIIEEQTDKVGLYVYAIGFIAAAVSSMFTCPLGATFAAQSIFTLYAESKPASKYTETNSAYDGDSKDQKKVDLTNVEENEVCVREFPKKMYHAMNGLMVLIAVIVIAANADRVNVIQTAQVFNGCLLPFFCFCLLICINDSQFMGKSPQKAYANVALIVAVLITLFLTGNTIIQNLFDWVVTKGHTSKSTFQTAKFSISGGCSIVIMVVMLFCTSLGKDVLRSFKRKENVVSANQSQKEMEASAF